MAIPIFGKITMKRFLIPWISILALFISNSLQAKIIHVPADSSTIQAGINGATEGDTVLVARGHFCESIDFLGKAILIASNFIFDNDTTTIDSTIIEGENNRAVVYFTSGERSVSSIRGFTITHEDAANGGGIHCMYSSPAIQHNIIKGNYSTYYGGGIWCHRLSSPLIANNTINANLASFGGGIYCSDRSSPVICNNTVTGNFASSVGGGICCGEFCSLVVNHNIIIENSAGSSGGGIACFEWSTLNITNNIILGNSAVNDGGGICCVWGCWLVVENNTIIGNSASMGGGISCGFGFFSTINNNLIGGNFADYGGGIYCVDSDPIISGNLIDGNSANSFGGGIRCSDASPVIVNNIILNSLDGEGIACNGYYSHPTVSYNDAWNNADGNFYGCPAEVGDTTWGINFNRTPCDSFYNIIRDPLFVDTIDFELLCNSPCIDAGNPSFCVPSDSGGCRIDMGAREYLYILGDATGDSTIDIGDVLFVINYLYKNGAPPCPYHAGDSNCDGVIDLEDVLYLINYLYKGGPPPYEP